MQTCFNICLISFVLFDEKLFEAILFSVIGLRSGTFIFNSKNCVIFQIMNISTTVSHEDIVNISGKRVQLNTKLLSSSGIDKFGEHQHQPREKSKNIHQFCATSSVPADMSPEMRMKARFR